MENTWIILQNLQMYTEQIQTKAKHDTAFKTPTPKILSYTTKYSNNTVNTVGSTQCSKHEYSKKKTNPEGTKL